MKSVFWGIAGATLLTFLGRQAHATYYIVGDAMNLLAPGANSDHFHGNQIVARKSDGTIYWKSVEPVLQTTWTSIGKPSVGTKSGPSSAYRNGTMYYVVLGADGNIYENHGGTTWYNTFGAPPAGVGTAPVVNSIGDTPNAEMTVAVLDNNQMPWTRRMAPNGSVGPWQTAGTVYSVIGVPGMAYNSRYEPNIFSLDGYARTVRALCEYGSCWDNWTQFGGGVGNSGSAATSYVDQSGYNDISVAVLGTNNIPYVATSTDDGSSYGGFVSLGGPVANSSPAITYVIQANRTMVGVHRADGNYWVYGAPYAGTWTSIGHP